jgi:hypothetical protein
MGVSREGFSMSGALEMFVVQTRSPKMDDCAFCIHVEHGVIALATSATEATSQLWYARAAPTEVIGHVELGLAPSTRNVPGLRQYETPALDHFSEARLVAAAKLSNQRLRLQYG